MQCFSGRDWREERPEGGGTRNEPRDEVPPLGHPEGSMMNVRCRLGVSESCDRAVVTAIEKPGFYWGGSKDGGSPGWSVSFPFLLLELTSNIMALNQNRCNSGSQKSEGEFCEHQKSGCQQGWFHFGHHRPESFIASSWLWTALHTLFLHGCLKSSKLAVTRTLVCHTKSLSHCPF